MILDILSKMLYAQLSMNFCRQKSIPGTLGLNLGQISFRRLYPVCLVSRLQKFNLELDLTCREKRREKLRQKKLSPRLLIV